MDATGYLTTLAGLQSQTQIMLGALQAQFAGLQLPPLDASALTTGLQAVAAAEMQISDGAVDVVTAQAAVQGALAGTATAAQAAAQVVQQTGQAAQQSSVDYTDLQKAIEANTVAVQENSAQLATVAPRLNEVRTAQTGHTAATNEGAAAVRQFAFEGRALASEVLPGMGTGMAVVSEIYRAGGEAIRAAGDEEKAFTETTAIAGGVLTAAGIGAAAGFFGIFDAGLTTLKNTATQFQLTIPQVAGLQTTLQALGLPADSATMALRMLATGAQQMQQQIDAGKEPTGRMATALQILGVSAVGAGGQILPIGQLLPQIMTQFQATKTAADAAGTGFNAAGIAADLFGARYGAKLVGLLESGPAAWDKNTAAAQRYGIGAADQVEKLEKLHDATANAGLAFEGMALKIGSDVSPAVTFLVTKLGDAAQGYQQLAPWQRDAVVTLPLVAGGFLLAASAASAIGGVLGTVGGSLAQVAALMRGTATAAESLAAAEALQANAAKLAAGALTEEAVAAEAAEAATVSMVPGIGLIVAGVAAIAVGIAAWITSNDSATVSEGRLSAAAKQTTSDIERQVQALQQAGATGPEQIELVRGKWLLATQAVAGATLALFNAKAAQDAYSAAGLVGTGELNAQGQSWQALQTGVKAAQVALDQAQGSERGAGDELNKVLGNIAALNAGIQEHTTHLQGLAQQYSLTTSDAEQQARALDTVATAVKKASQTTADGISFQDTYNRALADAGLSADKWKQTLADLTAIEQAHDPTLKADVAGEIALADAFRTLTPDVAAAAVATDRANEAAARLSASNKALESDLRASGAASRTFADDLQTMAHQTSSALTDSLQQAAVAAVAAYHAADAQVANDFAALQVAQTLNLSQEEQKRLQQVLDADTQTRSDRKATADDAMKAEQGYLSEAAKAAQQLVTENKNAGDQIVGLARQIHADQVKEAHLSATEQIDGLGPLLKAHEAAATTLEHLYKQLMLDITTNMTGIGYALLKAVIDIGIQQLKNLSGEITDVTATAAADTKGLTADTAALTGQLAGEATQVRDLATAMTDSIKLQQVGDDLSKQVHARNRDYTQADLDGLHQTTEARRTDAAAAYTAAQASLANLTAVEQGYDATTKLSRAYSASDIANAQADYKTKSALLGVYKGEFDTALSAETSADTAATSQRIATANAEHGASRAAAAETRSDLKDVGAAYAELAKTAATSGGQINAVMDGAAQAAVASWHAADLQVIADEQALSQAMSVEARNQAQAKLDADKEIRDDAKLTAQEEINGYKAVAAAATSIADIQEQASRRAADQQRADAQSVRDAWGAAASGITADMTSMFDLQMQRSTETAGQAQAGLGQWLNAAINTYGQISDLETQLTQTTDLQTQARLTDEINGLKTYLAYYTAMAHQAAAIGQAADQLAHDRLALANAEAADAKAAQSETVASVGMIRSGIAQITTAATTAGQSMQAIVDPLKELLGGYQAPTTQEAQLQTQAAQIGIQIARLQEAGDSASDYIKTLEAQKAALDAQITGYQNERAALVTLATAEGDLAAARTKSIDTLRGSMNQLVADETTGLVATSNAARGLNTSIASLTASLTSSSSGLTTLASSATNAGTSALAQANADMAVSDAQDKLNRDLAAANTPLTTMDTNLLALGNTGKNLNSQIDQQIQRERQQEDDQKKLNALYLDQANALAALLPKQTQLNTALGPDGQQKTVTDLTGAHTALSTALDATHQLQAVTDVKTAHDALSSAIGPDGEQQAVKDLTQASDDAASAYHDLTQQTDDTTTAMGGASDMAQRHLTPQIDDTTAAMLAAADTAKNRLTPDIGTGTKGALDDAALAASGHFNPAVGTDATGALTDAAKAATDVFVPAMSAVVLAIDGVAAAIPGLVAAAEQAGYQAGQQAGQQAAAASDGGGGGNGLGAASGGGRTMGSSAGTSTTSGGGSAAIASYQLGTRYVPDDQLAYLHKGEQVLPPGLPTSTQQGAPLSQQLVGGGGAIGSTALSALSYDVGTMSVQGFIDGVTSQQSAVAVALAGLGGNAAATFTGAFTGTAGRQFLEFALASGGVADVQLLPALQAAGRGTGQPQQGPSLPPGLVAAVTTPQQTSGARQGPITNNWTINVQGGNNPQETARAVRQEINAWEREVFGRDAMLNNVRV